MFDFGFIRKRYKKKKARPCAIPLLRGAEGCVKSHDKIKIESRKSLNPINQGSDKKK